MNIITEKNKMRHFSRGIFKTRFFKIIGDEFDDEINSFLNKY